jgi:thiamine phosphate synthase YjbQ (UPF0047 family)
MQGKMKSYRKELWFDTKKRTEFINITPQVLNNFSGVSNLIKIEDCLKDSGINEGLCLVNAMHITASVFINDDERGLHRFY